MRRCKAVFGPERGERAISRRTAGKPRWRRGVVRRAFLLCGGALAGVILAGLSPATAADVPAVWFGPAAESGDYLKLFSEPNTWRRARSKVNAFVFGPSAVTMIAAGASNSLADFSRVDAFRRLREWGIATVVEAPAVKPWDCSGREALAYTKQMIANVGAAGGTIDALSLDEPLVAGTGRTLPACGLAVDDIATRVAAYAAGLGAASGRAPDLYDVEAYPSFSLGDLQGWITALDEHSFHPKGLTLDIDLNAVEQSPESRFRLAPDLRALKQFLKTHGVAFGVIVWSGHDPMRSDHDYYDFAMDWARTLHAAVGRPDYLIFESWVTRCSLSRRCSDPGFGCSAGDPPDCGKKSIPRNLPEGDPGAYAHTRLIGDALAILRRN